MKRELGLCWINSFYDLSEAERVSYWNVVFVLWNWLEGIIIGVCFLFLLLNILELWSDVLLLILLLDVGSSKTIDPDGWGRVSTKGAIYKRTLFTKPCIKNFILQVYLWRTSLFNFRYFKYFRSLGPDFTFSFLRKLNHSNRNWNCGILIILFLVRKKKL